MLRPSISSHIPLASADSAGVSGGVGAYRHASDPVRAQFMLEAYEAAPAAAAWAGVPEQAELFL
jgi:hypothetical protein